MFNLMCIPKTRKKNHAAADLLLSGSSMFKACNNFGHDSGIPPGRLNYKSFPRAL